MNKNAVLLRAARYLVCGKIDLEVFDDLRLIYGPEPFDIRPEIAKLLTYLIEHADELPEYNYEKKD